MAREDVGTLVARLTADTQGLRADMAKAQAQVNGATARMNRSLARTEKHTRSLAAGFKGVRLAVIATATVMAGRFIKSQIDSAAAVLDTSNKIGVQVESLQELRFAAEQYGIKQNQTDLALQRFSRRVGEAVKGQGELRQTLEDYNIALTDSGGRTRSVEAILLDYADAIQGAESQQEKLRLAFKAFDSEGAAFVNVMQDGSEGIKEFVSQANDLGIVMDEAMLRRAKAASDQLTVLSNVIRTQLTIAIADNADTIAEWSSFAVEKIGDVVQGWRQIFRAMSELRQGNFENAFNSLTGIDQESIDRRLLTPNAFRRSRGGGNASGIEANPEAFPFLTAGGAGPLTGGARGLGTPQEAADELVTISEDAVSRIEERVIESAERQRAAFVRSRELMADSESMLTALNEQETGTRLANTELILSAATGAFALLGTQSKTAFKLTKTLGIAEAIINTQRGIAQALAAYPPPLSFGMAGLVAAKGAATVAAIRSQSFSGGGSPSFAGGAGVALAASTPPVAQAAEALPQQAAVKIVFQGDVNGWDSFIENRVIEGIRSAVNERDVVIIGGRSRNAAEITEAVNTA